MHGTLNVRSTYKTSAALGLSQEEFDALAWFVEQYDAGLVADMEHEAVVQRCEIIKITGPLERFYMPAMAMDTSCGTAGCILGWAAHRVVNDIYHDWPRALDSLFYHYPEWTRATEARDATVRVLRGEQAWPR